MQTVTKEMIAEVRLLAYANLAKRQAMFDSFTSHSDRLQNQCAIVAGFAKVGSLSLTLDYVSTKNLGKKALRDTYKIDGKVIAKAKILEILPE